jgi:type II secretory pathway component PulF
MGKSVSANVMFWWSLISALLSLFIYFGLCWSVPQFQALFEGADTPLPKATAWALETYPFLPLLALIGGYAALRFYRCKQQNVSYPRGLMVLPALNLVLAVGLVFVVLYLMYLPVFLLGNAAP